MAEDGVDLADVITQVRGDLERAIWSGEGRELGFVVEEVEIQLEVAVTRASKPGAKVRLMVVEAEGRYERSQTARHHVKVVLHPRLRADPDGEVLVADQTQAGEG